MPPSLQTLAAEQVASCLVHEDIADAVVKPFLRLLGVLPEGVPQQLAVTVVSGDSNFVNTGISGEDYSIDEILSAIVEMQPAESRHVMLSAIIKLGRLTGPRLAPFLLSTLLELNLSKIKWNRCVIIVYLMADSVGIMC